MLVSILMFLGALAVVIAGGVIGGILTLILINYAIKSTIGRKMW